MAREDSSTATITTTKWNPAAVPQRDQRDQRVKNGHFKFIFSGTFSFHLTPNLANCLLERVSCLGSYWEPAALRASVRLGLGHSQDFVKMLSWES